MEIGQLEAFLMTVRLHSISRAAVEIGVTQPSLSARIHALEAELGGPLFHRIGRGVRLTDVGRTFLPFVQRAMDTLQTGRDAIESGKTGSAGKLHIGAARSISANVLPGILETFRQRHPGVDVAIKTGRSTEVLDWVLSEEIQVGVARALYHPEVSTTMLYDEQIVLATHPSHAFALAGVASIHEVASEPLIVYDKESTYFVLIDRVCREAGISPNIQMDLDSIESTKRISGSRSPERDASVGAGGALAGRSLRWSSRASILTPSSSRSAAPSACASATICAAVCGGV